MALTFSFSIQKLGCDTDQTALLYPFMLAVQIYVAAQWWAFYACSWSPLFVLAPRPSLAAPRSCLRPKSNGAGSKSCDYCDSQSHWVHDQECHVKYKLLKYRLLQVHKELKYHNCQVEAAWSLVLDPKLSGYYSTNNNQKKIRLLEGWWLGVVQVETVIAIKWQSVVYDAFILLIV